ncbi:MAG TPA: type II toxin-antitoxin system RelE/ParE family toxin [Thermoanaerobaculia bacterium]
MKRFEIEVSGPARRQVLSALRWWLDNRSSASNLLAEEVRKALDLIAERPGVGHHVPSRRLRDVRCHSIGRSGYSIYYRVLTERVRVLSLWHESRGRKPRF